MKTSIIVIIALLFLFTSCQKEVNNLTDPFDPSVAKVIKNEPFGADTSQKADIYLPANRSDTTKVLVLLHGGSWSAGDKTDLDDFIAVLSAQYPNAAIINMNYRLAGLTNKYPTQITDIKLLLDYVEAHRTTWHISNSFGLGGVSAGGQLALMYAYKFDVQKRIKTVVSVVGPTNFLDPYYLSNPLFLTIAGTYIGAPISDTTTYKNASPAYAVTASAPPTFMAYGGSDILVPESNATLLKQKLISNNIPYEYNFYPTEQHEFSDPVLLETAIKITAFIKKYL